MKRLLLSSLFVGILGCSTGPRIQSPAPELAVPSTDIYLYRFGGFARPRGVFNITNRKGYDNQPYWDSNDRLLYTSQGVGQYDIYEIDFVSARISRVTDTPESEYSASASPDGESITVVRVERDSAQRLWRFPRRGGEAAVLLPDIKPVGYYAWLDTTMLALYVLGTPNSLRIANSRTGAHATVANNIGRSLQRVPGSRRASFLHRVGNRWILKTVDPIPRPDGSHVIDSLAVMPDSADYVAWRSDRELYSAAGSRILRLRLPTGGWEVVDDLSGRGIRGISRLALSPDGSRLAFVANDST